jgi:hypothetical protein
MASLDLAPSFRSWRLRSERDRDDEAECGVGRREGGDLVVDEAGPFCDIEDLFVTEGGRLPFS